MLPQWSTHLRPEFPRARLGGRSAFTLVEVLCVVVILAIAAAVALPQIESNDDLAVSAAARAVMADLLYAQNRAISQQSMQYVAFDTATQNYTLYTSVSPPTIATHPVNGNNYVMTFGQAGANEVSETASLTSVNFGGNNTVAFDETGVPYSYNGVTTAPLAAAGAIVLSAGSASLTISVAQDTGEITVN